MTRRAKPERLIDVAPVIHDRWTGSVALVRLGEVCPNGHGPLASTSATQGVLVRHCGYGAPVRTTWLHCLVCWWSYVAERSETHPRDWAKP